MRLLLDTHIWLWSTLQPERLRSVVGQALEDAENELWLSPISIWETLVLARKGRLELNEPVEPWIESALRRMPHREAPLTHEVARETGNIQLSHRDPADLFLVATARVFDLTLVTADRSLIRSGAVPVLKNR